VLIEILKYVRDNHTFLAGHGVSHRVRRGFDLRIITFDNDGERV
jgi:hypothetical protein